MGVTSVVQKLKTKPLGERDLVPVCSYIHVVYGPYQKVQISSFQIAAKDRLKLELLVFVPTDAVNQPEARPLLAQESLLKCEMVMHTGESTDLFSRRSSSSIYGYLSYRTEHSGCREPEY